MQTVGLRVKAAKAEVKPEVKEDFKPEVEELEAVTEAPKTDDKKLKGKKAAK